MRFITLDNENKIVSIRFGKSIVEGEMQSDAGELGQIMQEDGTFITPEPVPTEPVETLEQKIDRLEQLRQADNLMQLEVLATIFEELAMIGSV